MAQSFTDSENVVVDSAPCIHRKNIAFCTDHPCQNRLKAFLFRSNRLPIIKPEETTDPVNWPESVWKNASSVSWVQIFPEWCIQMVDGSGTPACFKEGDAATTACLVKSSGHQATRLLSSISTRYQTFGAQKLTGWDEVMKSGWMIISLPIWISDSFWDWRPFPKHTGCKAISFVAPICLGRGSKDPARKDPGWRRTLLEVTLRMRLFITITYMWTFKKNLPSFPPCPGPSASGRGWTSKRGQDDINMFFRVWLYDQISKHPIFCGVQNQLER